jgi:hypothetical protein
MSDRTIGAEHGRRFNCVVNHRMPGPDRQPPPRLPRDRSLHVTACFGGDPQGVNDRFGARRSAFLEVRHVRSRVRPALRNAGHPPRGAGAFQLPEQLLAGRSRTLRDDLHPAVFKVARPSRETKLQRSRAGPPPEADPLHPSSHPSRDAGLLGSGMGSWRGGGRGGGIGIAARHAMLGRWGSDFG